MTDLTTELRRKELETAQALFAKTGTIAVVPAYDVYQSEYVIIMAAKDTPSMDAYFTITGQQGNQPTYQQLLRDIFTMMTLMGFEIYAPHEGDNGFELHLFDPYDSKQTFPNILLDEAHNLIGLSS
jgi:hypothetical protein